MRVLFLDDDPRRTAEIRRHIGEHCDLTTVETADECIEQLGAHRFDFVLLDHDLGGEIYCDSSREDCGMEVVRWLRISGLESGRFFLHSHNAPAAGVMAMELSAAGHETTVAPFGSSEFNRAIDRALQQSSGRKRSSMPRMTFGDRLRRYFRSLRLGR